ncbi:F-box/kelch-repeat protein At3g06240-like [Papaver somniferum]|uniref:F-box/kelch-repeat protein At3g06240-like n=1 Tax=Papaver somniferum TaxID=3469 RepID=UPI000E6F7A2C|nr:F-box/kelch-repeat protein At3g06240-like [Papaver somniferum]
MYLHHLSTAEDFGKLGFLAFTRTEIGEIVKFHYFEYNENPESTTPIERVRRLNIIPPIIRYINRLDFIGSYNGLTCIVVHSSVYSCNPVTGEYIVLPEIKIDYRVVQCWTTGFGYVAATNEYKVIRVLMLRKKSVEVHMYTLGSGNGWRNLENINFKFEFLPLYLGQGIFANGNVYWLDMDLDRIITFDLAEEKFCGDLFPPPCPPESEYARIGVMDGFLFVAVNPADGGARCYDIWLLKKKNDNHDMNEGDEHQSLLWCREFRVDDCKLVAITKSGGVLTSI